MIFSADLALHRLGLLGHEDHAHAALADLLQQLVVADAAARAFQRRHSAGGLEQRRRAGEAAGPIVRLQQRLDALPQLGLAAARAVENGGTARGVARLDGEQEHLLNASGIDCHGIVPPEVVRTAAG